MQTSALRLQTISSLHRHDEVGLSRLLTRYSNLFKSNPIGDYKLEYIFIVCTQYLCDLTVKCILVECEDFALANQGYHDDENDTHLFQKNNAVSLFDFLWEISKCNHRWWDF